VVNLRTWQDREIRTAHLAGRAEATAFATLTAVAAEPDAHQLAAGLRPLLAGA